MKRLDRRDWIVKPVDRATCAAVVEAFHYAGGGPNTGVYMHGLFRRGEDVCSGVAWWLPPTRRAAEATYPDNWRGRSAQRRFVPARGIA